MSIFEEYTEQYGCHFNKRLYDWAIGMMRDRNGNKLPPLTKEQASEWLRSHNVTLKDDKGHDAAYVLAMGRADYMGSSIADDNRLALFVKDYIEDPDGYPTKAFDHFVIDCRAKGEPIFWDEMI